MNQPPRSGNVSAFRRSRAVSPEDARSQREGEGRLSFRAFQELLHVGPSKLRRFVVQAR